MNAKIMTRLAVFAVAGSLLAGCATQQGTNTAVGTGVGAGTGAALGAIFGGGKGAAIGAGVGAAVGGITGYNWQAIHNKLSGATKGTGTQITEQPDGSLKLNIPSSVTFDTNSYAIKPSFAPVLDQLSQTLQQNPEIIAQVVGYTDSTGSAGVQPDAVGQPRRKRDRLPGPARHQRRSACRHKAWARTSRSPTTTRKPAAPRTVAWKSICARPLSTLT